MWQATPSLALPEDELDISAIRAQGPGGQHVNKTESAVQLRFNVLRSSLPADLKPRLLSLAGKRATADGDIVIKAQTHRSQEQNRSAALLRLAALIAKAETPPVPRKATQPSKTQRRKRTDDKVKRGAVKRLRGPAAD